jgi:hypothetical protein
VPRVALHPPKLPAATIIASRADAWAEVSSA